MSLYERHGLYGRRPKVEMPEKTESAFEQCQTPSMAVQRSSQYLGAAISGQCIVPQGLMRSCHANLLFVVAMGCSNCREARDKERSRSHFQDAEEKAEAKFELGKELRAP
jgi:hypothetical protein